MTLVIAVLAQEEILTGKTFRIMTPPKTTTPSATLPNLQLKSLKQMKAVAKMKSFLGPCWRKVHVC